MKSPAKSASSITPDQVRDARTKLGWTRQSLSFASKTTVHFISVYEEQGRVGRLYLRKRGFDGLGAIRVALEQAGVEFIDGDQPDVERQPK